MRSFIDRPDTPARSGRTRRPFIFAALSALPGLMSVLVVAAPAPLSFDFTAGGNAASHPLFDAAQGYGFEPDAPGRFSVQLAEGNYRLTVRLAATRAAARTTVRAEQRRLMLEDVLAPRSQTVARVFNVNVRTPALGELPANAPGGIAVKLNPRELGALNWDGKLTLEFVPDAAAVSSISIELTDVPTLYLAGDSTVTDQAIAPNASWGQVLPRFLDAGVAVANHAESGATLKSFFTEMRFDKLLTKLRAGDWVMIQFAHNDQKTQWPQTYADAATTYRAWLRVYIAEVLRRGATPILVTSPDRRNFDSRGKISSTLGGYPAAMRAVADEEHIALLDLNASSREFYEALGPELAPRAFADSGRDQTHFNDYGAYQLASCVVERLRAADPALTGGLAAHLLSDTPRYDPAHPTPPPGLRARQSTEPE